jgi:hypothetical protein
MVGWARIFSDVSVVSVFHSFAAAPQAPAQQTVAEADEGQRGPQYSVLVNLLATF